jgi:hypothetical protein
VVVALAAIQVMAALVGGGRLFQPPVLAVGVAAAGECKE